MCYPQITCYHPQRGTSESFSFYILSKGENAGKPCLSPWVNCFTVDCVSREDLDFYYWLCYSLYQTGRFKAFLRGSVVSFLCIGDVRRLLTESGTTIQPHWQSLQGVIEALNKLKTARAHLARSIIANEKLQSMLLKIHF